MTTRVNDVYRPIDFTQLKQLGELHVVGILTDEEFASQKAKLLAS